MRVVVVPSQPCCRGGGAAFESVGVSSVSRWMEACLDEELPPTTELEEGLRNGVYLAKLGNFFAPRTVSLKKIYDREQTRYKVNTVLISNNLPRLEFSVLSDEVHMDKKVFSYLLSAPLLSPSVF